MKSQILRDHRVCRKVLLVVSATEFLRFAQIEDERLDRPSSSRFMYGDLTVRSLRSSESPLRGGAGQRIYSFGRFLVSQQAFISTSSRYQRVFSRAQLTPSQIRHFFMSIETVTTFLALLALAVQVALVLVVLISTSVGLRSALVANVGPLALWAAAAIATVAMVGSLYLSEVAHFTPCKLCWYQRIAMYSSAILLLIAGVRKDVAVRRYVVPLVSIGALISSYHLLIERYPNLESSTCDPNNPCSLIWIKKFGYLTIPGMALTGFLAILVVLHIHRLWERGLHPKNR